MKVILNGILLSFFVNIISNCSSIKKFDASKYMLSDDLQNKILVYDFYPSDINTTVQKVENNCLLYTERFPSIKLDEKTKNPIYKYTICVEDNKMIRDGVVVLDGNGIWNKKIATVNNILLIYPDSIDPPSRCTISKKYKKELLGKNRDILEVTCKVGNLRKSVTVYASGIGFIRKTVNGISTHGLKDIRRSTSTPKDNKS